MRLPASLDVLGERRFRLLFGARSISAFGGTMAELALAFAVLGIGRPRDLGFVILAREIPLVALLLLGGVWADRVPRQLVLISTDLVRAAAQAATAALLLTGSATVLTVALLQVIYGGATAFGRPAFTGLLPQIVPTARLQEANAVLGLSRSVVAIGGPAVGALIVAAANPGWALAADAATFVVSAALLTGIRLPRTSRLAGSTVLSDLREGWRELVSRSWVWTMIASFAMFQLTVFPALLVLGPYVAKTELGGAGAWGTILAVEAVGALAGGTLALHVRFARPLVAALLLATPAALQLVLIGRVAPVWLIASSAFLAGACLALNDAVWFATLQEKIPAHAISRISSFDWLGSVALNPIGYALVGPLSEAIGVPAALYLAAAINVTSILAVLSVPSVRALRAGPEAAPAPA